MQKVGVEKALSFLEGIVGSVTQEAVGSRENDTVASWWEFGSRLQFCDSFSLSKLFGS